MKTDDTTTSHQDREDQAGANEELEEELGNLHEQTRRKTEQLKTILARQLAAAWRTLSFLESHGHKGVLREPQYFEYVEAFSRILNELPELPKQPTRRGDVSKALRSVLENATSSMTEKDLRKQVGTAMGKSVAPLNHALERMIEAGLAEKNGELYSLAGKFKETGVPGGSSEPQTR